MFGRKQIPCPAVHQALAMLANASSVCCTCGTSPALWRKRIDAAARVVALLHWRARATCTASALSLRRKGDQEDKELISTLTRGIQRLRELLLLSGRRHVFFRCRSTRKQSVVLIVISVCIACNIEARQTGLEGSNGNEYWRPHHWVK